jgi:hypothetical protein
VRDQVALGHVKALHVPTSSQYANIFTKGLPSAVFTEFRSSLNVAGNDDPTAGMLARCIYCIWPSYCAGHVGSLPSRGFLMSRVCIRQGSPD